MKLLCATDFSPTADRTIAVAAGLADRLGDSLELVHVVESPPAIVAEFAVSGAELMASLREASDRQLERLAALHDGRLRVTWKTITGFAEEDLLRYAEEENARLLAVGTHSRKGAARLFLGSVAERVVRRAHLPVLVVPAAPPARAEPEASNQIRRPLRIVAGVDASPASDVALAWLRTLAETTPCDLALVHAYWPLREHARFGIDEIGDAFEAKAEIAALLERELRPRINEALGGRPARLRLRPTLGNDADPLAHEAELADADLLVVGSSQRRDRWGGSTAIGTIRTSRRPVLCIPALLQGVPRPIPRTPLRTLLVPCDLSDTSRASLAMAYEMLHDTGGVVEVVHVARPAPASEAPEHRAQQRAQIERQLAALIPEVHGHHVLTRTSVIESAAPAQAILHAAERLLADAIVLTSHSRSGLRRTFVGSVAEQVMHATKKPVMVVPVPA